MALTPGARVGVYEVTAPLGEGGMGQVWRATATTLGRQVAITIRVDEQVDVLGGARTTVRDHGEPADHHVADGVGVQRTGEADKLVELWLTCVRAIIRVIHASASSKLLKR